MTEVPISCVICFLDLSIDRFRFLECGHGFCVDCVYTLRECAICRHSISPFEEPRQIYITFGEPKQAPTLADSLDKINRKSPSVSLRRAAKKVRAAAKTADESTLKNLLEAVTRMESILCPISEELEQEKAKRASAVAKLVVLQRRQEELDERLSGVDELEQQLQDVNDEWMAALASKERTKQRLQREATENARLKKLNEKFQGALKDTKEEVVKLETALEESKNQIQITKKKLRVLTKQIPKATAQKQNPDDSLHVLKPDDEEETGRQLIKRRRLIRT